MKSWGRDEELMKFLISSKHKYFERILWRERQKHFSSEKRNSIGIKSLSSIIHTVYEMTDRSKPEITFVQYNLTVVGIPNLRNLPKFFSLFPLYSVFPRCHARLRLTSNIFVCCFNAD